MCDLDPKVKVVGKNAGICDGVPSTDALVDLCFGRDGVLLNSKLNHIDDRSASVNMTFTVP